MIDQNHWGVFKDSLARWDIEFPAALWTRWSELLRFADEVFALGRSEEVFIVDSLPAASTRDRALFGDVTPAARVSVFGRAGVEDRVVRDLRAELLALRPEIASGVPHASA